MADNLESFFKKHLTGETSGTDNWNVPSDDVWAKALPEIQKKRGLFIPWSYVYILGTAFIIATLLVFWIWKSQDTDTSNNKVNDLLSKKMEYAYLNYDPKSTIINENTNTENKYTNSNDKNIDINESLQDQGKIAENNPATSSSLPPATAPATSPTPDPSISPVSEVTSSSSTVTAPSSSLPPATAPATSPTPDPSISPVSEVTSSSSTATAPTTAGTMILSSGIPRPETEDIAYAGTNLQSTSLQTKPLIFMNIIQPKLLVYKYDHRKYNITEKETENEINTLGAVKTKRDPISYKKKFGIGAYYSATFTATNLSGEMIEGLDYAPNMFLYSGGYGFEVKYYLSDKFALVSGFERSAIKSWSRSELDFGYNSSTEIVMEDMKENTSSVPMLSPFGEINTAVTYRFPGSDNIPDGELLQSVLETHQTVMYLSVPLGLQYNIINFSGFNWFAEAGGRFNHAINDATEFSSRILHNGHDMEVMGEEIMSKPNYTKNYFDYYLGTGFSYNFSSNIQATTSARYFRSLSRVNLQEGMSTYVRGFNLKIGIIYYF